MTTDTARISVIACGGLITLIVVVAGIAVHFEYLGQRRSWQILAWMLDIGILLIMAAPLL